jgi:hypothetical protein
MDIEISRPYPSPSLVHGQRDVRVCGIVKGTVHKRQNLRGKGHLWYAEDSLGNQIGNPCPTMREAVGGLC